MNTPTFSFTSGEWSNEPDAAPLPSRLPSVAWDGASCSATGHCNLHNQTVTLATLSAS